MWIVRYSLRGEPMKSILGNRIVIGAVMLGDRFCRHHQLLPTNTYKFGAAPGDREYFDYITFDSDSRRVYLTHGSEVLVERKTRELKRERFPG